jgi:membrane protein implicated in regulation of membrane protease activity
MSEWVIWMVLAGVMVVVEMFTGTFYLLMVGVGMAAGGLAALVGANGPVQLVIAAAVGILATYALRRSGFGRHARTDAARDPNVNLDIGQTVTVEEWQRTRAGPHTARSMYRGAMWDIELPGLEEGASVQPGRFVIREVRGNRLIVAVANNN